MRRKLFQELLTRHNVGVSPVVCELAEKERCRIFDRLRLKKVMLSKFNTVAYVV